MRKFSNVVIGLVAAGVCALITYLTLDSSFTNIVYNLCFLAVMLMIMAVGFGVGFTRLIQTRNGLDRATKKMQQLSASGGNMATITARIDEKTKLQAEEIASSIGLNLSSVINVFVNRFVAERGFPFAVSDPKTVQMFDRTELTDAVAKAIRNKNGR